MHISTTSLGIWRVQSKHELRTFDCWIDVLRFHANCCFLPDLDWSPLVCLLRAECKSSKTRIFEARHTSWWRTVVTWHSRCLRPGAECMELHEIIRSRVIGFWRPVVEEHRLPRSLCTLCLVRFWCHGGFMGSGDENPLLDLLQEPQRPRSQEPKHSK